MRIAIANWNRRCIGGVETYLDGLIPALLRTGNEISFWSELDEPADRAAIALPENVQAWCAAQMGTEKALAALRAWQPDLLFAHKLLDADVEQKLIELTCAVSFVHDYNGMCISGSKTFLYPTVQPCSRRFGPACLLHYFPRRCGGLSPLTMLQLYGVQNRRLENLHKYKAIVAQSDHMAAELTRHGLTPYTAFKFSASHPSNGKSSPAIVQTKPLMGDARELRLLFSGRMEYLKGAHVLIDSAPQVAAALDRPLRITLAGDGRERAKLERRASALKSDMLTFEFVGWINKESLEELYASSDLLVVPSLWPEPFGMIGPEAGRFGLPVAAFGSGGIADWLVDGVNGYAARESLPNAHGLTRAIVSCLSNPANHERLRRGAREVSAHFMLNLHVNELLRIFKEVSNVSEYRVAGADG